MRTETVAWHADLRNHMCQICLNTLDHTVHAIGHLLAAVRALVSGDWHNG